LLPWQLHFGKFEIFWHKIAYKSACTADRPETLEPNRGGGCDHGDQPLARSGDPVAYRLVYYVYVPLE